MASEESHVRPGTWDSSLELFHSWTDRVVYLAGLAALVSKTALNDDCGDLFGYE